MHHHRPIKPAVKGVLGASGDKVAVVVYAQHRTYLHFVGLLFEIMDCLGLTVCELFFMRECLSLAPHVFSLSSFDQPQL